MGGLFIIGGTTFMQNILSKLSLLFGNGTFQQRVICYREDNDAFASGCYRSTMGLKTLYIQSSIKRHLFNMISTIHRQL